MNPRGYAVAGVSVRSYFTTTFPGQLLDIRKAIRWLRVNADTYGIDPDQISIIGSSSGGWLAAMAGVTSDIDVLTAQGEDDTDGVSSAVKASVPFFPPVDFLQMDSWYEENPSVPSFIVHNSPLEPIEGDYYPDPLNSFASLASFEALFLRCLNEDGKLVGVQQCPAMDVAATNPITYIDGPNEVPMLLFHGQQDFVVPPNQSELLYEAMKAAGSEAIFVSLPDRSHFAGVESFNPTGLLPILDDENFEVFATSNAKSAHKAAPTWDFIDRFISKA